MAVPRTAEQWEARLRADPPVELSHAELRGCARLMAAYMEGAQWVERRAGPERSSRVAGFVPSIVVALPDDRYPPISTRNDGTDVLILGSHLRWWARQPEGQALELHSRTGEVLMSITPIDFFRLAGVEETHHLLSIREGRLRPQKRPDPVYSTFGYHATDLEFAALEEKIAFADEKRMPPGVRLRLRAIHAGALRVRAARRSASPAAHPGLALS